MTAQGTLVFSFGIFNTKEEADRVAEELKGTVTMLRNISALTRERKNSLKRQASLSGLEGR